MGTNYVESSLKRFLKRKVKVTLGLVVAFMITGTVGFAETLEQGIYGNDTYQIEITDKGDVVFKGFEHITADGSDYRVSKDYLNDSSIKYLKKILENFEVSTALSSEKINGIIINTTTQSQSAEKINNESTITNNGILLSQSLTQKTDSNKTIINNGIIIARNYDGQYSTVKGASKMYNHGLIMTKERAQRISDGVDAAIYNYGNINIIGEENNTAAAQIVLTGKNNKVYNFGMITVKDGLAMNIKGDTNKGYNYGIIKAGENSSIFSDNVINRGIIVSDKTDLNFNDEKFAHSVVLGVDGNLRNTGKVYQLQGDLSNNGTESKDVVFAKTSGHNITDNLTGKTVISLITDKTQAEKPVFNLGSSVTKLDDTVITGYFTETDGGTLVNVGTDVTLKDSIINAIKGINAGDVNAVYVQEGAKLTLEGTSEIAGKIIGDGEIGLVSVKSAGLDLGIKNVEFSNKSNDYTDLTLSSADLDIMNLVFRESSGENNKINLTYDVKAGTVDGSSSTENIDISIDNLDSVTGKTIKLGSGEDSVTVKAANERNIFDYKMTDVEKLVFGEGVWQIDDSAEFSFDKNQPLDNKVIISTEGTASFEINNDNGNITGKATSTLEKLSDSAYISKDSSIKYVMGEDFKLNGSTYIIEKDITKEDEVNITGAIIFKTETDKTADKTTLTLKTAEDFGIENDSVYNALLGGINQSEYVKNLFNGYTEDKQVISLVNRAANTGKAYYTAGSVVTKNITDSYLSSVEDFTKKAKKGEWLAQGKYINSDTEFDGGSRVKGYDGDINSAVGMIEYGVSDATSYGVAFGGGDTEVNIDGGGKLDGDNYYLGAYVKHRTQNGIDLVGNFGFVKSDLDSKLMNSLTLVDNQDVEHTFMNKDSLVDGTADSTAFALSLKGTKDYYVADTIKLQPVLGARLTLINQDKAENKKMGFEVKEQDIYVVEGTAGLNAVKEVSFESGKAELKIGAEYTLASSSENHDARYELFGREVELEDSDIASSKGTFHVGADYEHENGVGFNAKYEMMWSDEGDDSRITAGISYRF